MWATMREAPARATRISSRFIDGIERPRPGLSTPTRWDKGQWKTKQFETGSGRRSLWNDVVLFMKGTPQIPQYGFSAAVTEILSHLGVAFSGVNVLEDDAIVRASRSFPTGRPFHSFM